MTIRSSLIGTAFLWGCLFSQYEIILNERFQLESLGSKPERTKNSSSCVFYLPLLDPWNYDPDSEHGKD